MTEMILSSPGASSTQTLCWNTIEWKTVQANVRRLQRRIAKAFREKKYSKAKALQWLLTHSFHAKLLAVKRATQNKGAKTPGVDQVTWKTPKQKLQAALTLKRRGYQTSPLKRVYIPKKQSGKTRPLSIPTMRCRAMQALYLFALEPIAEMMADKHAYGFRPRRSSADAIGRCFQALCRRTAARYILDADIHACFDTISHSWLINHVPMDKQMLSKWLQAGYIDDQIIHATEAGIPQGSPISPCLLVIALSGLEQAVQSVISYQKRDKIHCSIYADDFIITGASEYTLMTKVKPVVEHFLRERDLRLSIKKTKIIDITKGFDFLGMHIRRYNNGKLIIKPAKANVKAFLAKIKKTVQRYQAAKTEELIHELNAQIRGWTNYYRHVCAKDTFQYISKRLFKHLWQWAKKRHPNKSARWRRRKYFRRKGYRNWVFFSYIKTERGSTILDLIEPATVRIKRHLIIRADATPYDPRFKDYFIKRSWCRLLPAKGNTVPLEYELLGNT